MNWVALAVLLFSPWLLTVLGLVLRWAGRKRAVRERRHPVFGATVIGEQGPELVVPVQPGRLRLSVSASALNYTHALRQLKDPTGRYLIEPGQKCSHWPRTPVALADGTKVASICHKCDATVYHVPYVNAEDVAR